jgi:hypothetical protein
MPRRNHDDRTDHIGFGIVLVVLGTLFLLDRLDILDIRGTWSWWGVVPVAFGFVRIVAWKSSRSVASGVSWIFYGLWFLVSANEWYGLDWGTSWPMVFIAIGAGMVVRALLDPVFERRTPASSVSKGDLHA